MSTIEDELANIKKTQKPEGTKTLRYKGKTVNHDFYSIRTDLLKFNILNGRIGSNVKEFNQSGRDLSTMSDEEANSLIKDWIWKKSESENKRTYEDIKEKGQLEAGVVTRDGIIVDGNRRFMTILKINEDSSSDLYFKAVILDETYEDSKISNFEIKQLEQELQISVDEKVGYGPIEKYIRLKEFIEDYGVKDFKKLKKMFNVDSEKKIESMYEVSKLMDKYLKYINAKNMWSRLKNSEDLFINLEKNLNYYKRGLGNVKWNFDESLDVAIYEVGGFDLIRWTHNKPKNNKDDDEDWNTKEIRSLYFVNSHEKTVFANEKIFREFTNTIEAAKQSVELPSIKEHSKENNVEESVSAELIDKEWASSIDSAMKKAIGTAQSKIKNKKLGNRPSQLISEALDKLDNILSDEDELYSNNIINFSKQTLDNLLNEKEENIKRLDYIRRISEKLKRTLRES